MGDWFSGPLQSEGPELSNLSVRALESWDESHMRDLLASYRVRKMRRREPRKDKTAELQSSGLTEGCFSICFHDATPEATIHDFCMFFF